MNPDSDDVTFEFNHIQLSPEVDDVTFGLSHVQINTKEEDDDDVKNEEFTFMCINEKDAIPLFDQSLLYNVSNNKNEDGKRIKTVPPVVTSSSSSNEVNIKSNSTGFSNLRRLREDNNINRSKSDGREAFGFLNPKAREKKEVVKKKVEKPTVSALEEYLRKGEEERRKSYLPYSHIRRRPAQLQPSGMTGVLYASIKKSLKVASNILPS